MSVWCFLGSAGEGNDDYELLETVPLVEGLIGTDESCGIRLRDPLLTSRHARLVRKGDTWFIGGIAAMSPTLVNGVATFPGQAVQLAAGDVVQLANTRFRFGGEPRARVGVDANNEASVLMFADALAERGSPIGLRILEGQTPTAGWLSGLEQFVEGGVATPEWTRGLLTAVEVRELSLSSLRRLLEDDSAVALERLTVHLATCSSVSEWRIERTEEERLRAMLQVVGLARPPRLRHLQLGLLHQPLSDRPARDWAAISRRLPLEGPLRDAYRASGEPRFTMLRTCEGAPEIGVVTPVRPWVHQHYRRLVGEDRRRQRPYFWGADSEAVHFACEEEFTLNAAPSWEKRCLVHGDVVEAETFAFRFEEDPQ